ncbi:MAG TPA: AarF/UbiB family protein [Gemmatimonadaceae bacterium]|nr:AarF/UbiB family protein [Gemmatimonadaceae bacterium]
MILARLLPLVLSFARDRRRWLLAGAPTPRSAAFHQRRAIALVRAIAKLGPSFVKLAQVFAARADLVPEPYLSTLGTLADQVPAVPFDQVAATLLAAYGEPADALFEQLERTPIAAASLGQVHRARYRGEEVVVKVLRPGVEGLVAADLRIAERLLRVVARRWSNRHVLALQAVVSEFGTRIWEEMDFRSEARYAHEIRCNFAGRAGVIVPRVVPEMTRQRVLVLEYVEGRRIDAIDSWIAEGRVQPRALVSTVMELYLQMMLVDGLFHADPHPGNLLVAPDGRLVLLDFGMVVRVPRATRRHLVQTVFAAIRQDVKLLVEGFQQLEIVPANADLAPVRELAARLLTLARTHATTHERLERLLADEVMATLYDAPVTLPSDMVYFARTASLIEGLGTRYDPYFNAIDFAAPIAIRMRGRIMASLAGRAQPVRNDWPAVLGGILGEVAGVVTRAGRDIAAIFGMRLLGVSAGAAASRGNAGRLPARDPDAPLALPAAS